MIQDSWLFCRWTILFLFTKELFPFSSQVTETVTSNTVEPIRLGLFITWSTFGAYGNIAKAYQHWSSETLCHHGQLMHLHVCLHSAPKQQSPQEKMLFYCTYWKINIFHEGGGEGGCICSCWVINLSFTDLFYSSLRPLQRKTIIDILQFAIFVGSRWAAIKDTMLGR